MLLLLLLLQIDINECSDKTLNDRSQVCTYLNGTFQCSCYVGYDYDDKTHSCKATILCVNTTDCSYLCAVINGTDRCLCPKGQMLDEGGKTCKACNSNYYGPSCTLACHCEANQECDNIDGSCYSTVINTTTTSLPATSETTTTVANSYTSPIIPCESANNICNASKHETCMNKESGYECVCLSGFMKLNNSDCTEISSFNYTVTLNWDVPSKYLEDENSDDYKWLKNEVETQTFKRLKEKSENVLSARVTKLRLHLYGYMFTCRGSVIADYVIIMNKTVNSTTILSNAMNLIIKEGVELNGTTIFITNIIWNDAPNLCEEKQKTAPCKSSEMCVVEGNSAECKQVKSSEVKTELTIGLAVGLSLFGLFMVIIVSSIFICNHQNKTKNRISQSKESLQ